MKDILENKWTAVVKMKRQVMELEKQNKQLRESSLCEKCGGGGLLDDGGIIQKQMGGEGLPKVPEKFTLTGHREKITKLQLHPSFTLLATAS